MVSSSIDSRPEIMYQVADRALGLLKNPPKKTASYPITAVAQIIAGDGVAAVKKIEKQLKITPDCTPSLDEYLQMTQDAQAGLRLVVGWGKVLGAAMAAAAEDGMWKGWSLDLIAGFYNEWSTGTLLPKLDPIQIGDATFLLCCRDDKPFMSQVQQDRMLATTLRATIAPNRYPNVGVFFQNYQTLEQLPPLAGALESLLPPLGIEVVETKKGIQQFSESQRQFLDTKVEMLEERNILRDKYLRRLTTATLAQGRFVSDASRILLTQL